MMAQGGMGTEYGKNSFLSGYQSAGYLLSGGMAGSQGMSGAENRSELEDLSVVFFLENREKVTLTAQKGVLQTDTNDFQVSGQVVVHSTEYTMETSEVRYSHDGRKIFTNVPADIAGKSMEVRADRISFDLNSNQASLEGNVKGIIHGTIGF
jgi:LPS export ABC transporter protein LptC